MVDGTGSTDDFFVSKDGKSMWKTYRYDQDVTLPPCPFVKRDYVFNGWGTSENARERYDAGSVVRNLTAEQGGAVTLYAIWDTLYELPDPNPNKPVVASAGAPGVMALSAGAEDTLISYTKTYTYDLAGNRTSFVLTKNGEVVQNVTYTYDNLNRLATVSENGILQASYSYDVNGNRASLTYANGVEESYAYNKANWVVRLSGLWRNQTLTSFRYTYYASGSQKSETDHTGKITSYVYDGLGRLTQESETNGLTVRYSYDAAGNRARMAVTGTENYVTSYTYDANNRLLTETRTENGEPVTTTYTYDANGNTLRESAPAHSTTYTYDGFNQLISAKVDRLRVAYAYNARGVRTAKRVGWQKTAYLLDGGNVVGEVENNIVTSSYLRGVNLIRRESTDETEYYLFNAHADVVTTTNANGAVNHQYDYDAFGNEENPDPGDDNPFRYCGEYLDFETGSYYLRARYYDPTIGRFTQEDTHWSTANMIYGDNPQKINEREDKLGLKTYTNVPQITAVAQAGNLYVYGINNPVLFVDSNGHIAFMAITTLVGILLGGIGGAIQSYIKYGEIHWENVAIGAGIGGILGLGGGALASYFATGSVTASTSMVFAYLKALVKGGAAASLWGVARDGVNQGIRHFFEYAATYPKRIPQIAEKLGCKPFEISKEGFQAFTNALLNVISNYQKIGGQMRQVGQKLIYYYNEVIIIVYDGKIQSAMIGKLKTFLNMK